MASVLCIQQKMSAVRAKARYRKSYTEWLRGTHWNSPYPLGYREVKRWRYGNLTLTALEAR